MTLYIGGFSRVVTFPTAPIATGRSDPCRKGLAPSQEPCLSTAHAYVVLSPVTGLFCYCRPQSKVLSAPVGPTELRELDARVGASGPHDFAVRDQHLSSACLVIAHKSFDPPCDPVARKTLPRPPHPHPASVTIAIGPSGGVGWREFVEMICPTGEAKYFCKGDWTGFSTARPSGKSIAQSAVAFRCPNN